MFLPPSNYSFECLCLFSHLSTLDMTNGEYHFLLSFFNKICRTIKELVFWEKGASNGYLKRRYVSSKIPWFSLQPCFPATKQHIFYRILPISGSHGEEAKANWKNKEKQRKERYLFTVCLKMVPLLIEIKLKPPTW